MAIPKNQTTSLGTHILLELYDCPKALLLRPKEARAFLLAAAGAMNAIVVADNFHAFSPYGVSGVVIIQESHLTIHTWPEHAYAAIDIFSCGDLQTDAGICSLLDNFKPKRSEYKTIARGILNAP